MSDNYSIDDILAEIDRKRGGGSKSTESVTEIISETELHSDMNSTSHTRMPSAEESEPVSGDEEARERAESIRRAASPNVSPEPLRPRVRLACSDTHRRYSSTGTVENKLAAKKPFNAFTPVSRMLPLPF